MIMRFQYSWYYFAKIILELIVQINDRYEFPLELDLDRDDGKYLSPDADRSVRNLYTLHRYEFDYLLVMLERLEKHRLNSKKRWKDGVGLLNRKRTTIPCVFQQEKARGCNL